MAFLVCWSLWCEITRALITLTPPGKLTTISACIGFGNRMASPLDCWWIVAKTVLLCNSCNALSFHVYYHSKYLRCITHSEFPDTTEWKVSIEKKKMIYCIYFQGESNRIICCIQIDILKYNMHNVKTRSIYMYQTKWKGTKWWRLEQLKERKRKSW